MWDMCSSFLVKLRGQRRRVVPAASVDRQEFMNFIVF
jgi:hypothetical protein